MLPSIFTCGFTLWLSIMQSNCGVVYTNIRPFNHTLPTMASSTTFLLLLACSQLSKAAAIHGDAFSGGLVERDGCSNQKHSSDEDLCYTYCNTKTSKINGAPIKASDRVICDIDSCSDAHADSVTVTEGFTVTAGLSIDPITATGSFS